MIRIAAVILSPLFLAGCFSQPPVAAVNIPPASQPRASSSSSATPPAAAPSYQVKRGDTLYRIALDNGLSYRDIAAWNNISDPSVLREGQSLRLSPPGSENGATVAMPVNNGAAVEARPLDQSTSTKPASNGSLKREPRVGKEPYSDEAYARLARTAPQESKAPETKPEPRTESRNDAPPTPAASDDVAWQWPSSAKLSGGFGNGNKGMDFSGKAGDPILAAADGKVIYVGGGLRAEYGDMVVVQHKGGLLSVYAHNRKIFVKEGQQIGRGQKLAEMGNADANSVKLHFEIRKQGNPVDPNLYLPKR